MLSLFSGIGGIDLAAQWAGIDTVAFCEVDKFCRRVLAHHWPEVPIYGDVRELSADALQRDGIWPIDIICGGPPCQPVSLAGQRLGEADDRWLWGEALRIVAEVRPSWCLFENPPGIVTMGLDEILLYLEGIGYEARPLDIPAGAVRAPHRRHRIFILAHTAGEQFDWGGHARNRGAGFADYDAGDGGQRQDQSSLGDCTDGLSAWLAGWTSLARRPGRAAAQLGAAQSSGWCAESGSQTAGIGQRSLSGTSDFAIHGLGHSRQGDKEMIAAVPQQIYPIFAAIVARDQF